MPGGGMGGLTVCSMRMSAGRFINQYPRQNFTGKHRNSSRLQQKSYHKVNPKEITDPFYHPMYSSLRIFPIGFCADDAKLHANREVEKRI